MSIQAAIDAPRIHSEINLYEVWIESRVPEEVRKKLEEMGHKIVVKEAYSTRFASMQAIMIDPESGLMFAGSEPRTHGGARGY
ncbi:MAG: gamma-glutamyltransferase [Deltaproteobacteria bacterium]|nr:gamma-glutamyltransferase [Deltaproteobacteria bacterium]MBW2149504.1 gamma-glutamyltransferase [Deltaproteobacteria bacterium]